MPRFRGFSHRISHPMDEPSGLETVPVKGVLGFSDLSLLSNNALTTLVHISPRICISISVEFISHRGYDRSGYMIAFNF